MQDNQKTTVAEDVNSYLQALPESTRLALENVRTIIKTTAPLAAESIGYGMPGYKYLGPLIYFQASKKHLALYGVGKNIRAQFKTELQGFKIVGSSIHFTPEKPLPDSLVQKIIMARMQENEQRAAIKNKTKIASF